MAISGSSSGGGGGIMGAATQLGDTIHGKSLETMDFFQQLETANRERAQKEKEEAESKRRFAIEAAMKGRQQDMTGLDFLAGQRAQAGVASRSLPFNGALSMAVRGI